MRKSGHLNLHNLFTYFTKRTQLSNKFRKSDQVHLNTEAPDNLISSNFFWVSHTRTKLEFTLFFFFFFSFSFLMLTWLKSDQTHIYEKQSKQCKLMHTKHVQRNADKKENSTPKAKGRWSTKVWTSTNTQYLPLKTTRSPSKSFFLPFWKI